jgi:hypothetical protein
MNQQQYMQPPPQKSNTLKIVLIVLAALFVVGGASCAGCFFYGKSKLTELGENLADGGLMMASPKDVVDALAGPKKDYVGSWKSAAGSTCSIQENGSFTIAMNEGGDKKRMEGISIAAFEGNNIVVKMLIKMTFVVSKAPTKSGPGAEMTLDGVTFTKQ